MTDPQIVFVGGGMTFRNRSNYLDYLENMEISLEEEENWSDPGYLEENTSSDVIRVDMPCTSYARFSDWAIVFDKYLSKLEDDLIFIGYSLGATFLARYLSENNLDEDARAYLIAPPFDDNISGESLCSGFPIQEDLDLFEKNCEEIVLMFSKDDVVVPPRHAEKFNDTLGDAEILFFNGMNGHFRVKEFPELVNRI